MASSYNNLKFSIETIPAQKLLHYVKKVDIVDLIGIEYFTELKQQAIDNSEAFSVKYLKENLQRDSDFMNRLRNSNVGAEAFEKYADNAQRITNPELRAKALSVRSLTRPARIGYQGCIATRVEPRDIEYCTENYDNPEYQKISLFPCEKLKSKVYERTQNMALAPRPKQHISDLPRGLRAYIYKHPEQYRQYIEEKKAEIRYLKAVKRNTSSIVRVNPSESSSDSESSEEETMTPITQPRRSNRNQKR